MVQAWYIKDSFDESLKKSELHQDPPHYVEMKELEAQTGVLYWKLNMKSLEEDGVLEKIRHDRGYHYEDTIEICKDKLPDYDEKVKMFYTEHFHPDEEVRFVLEGSAYFDVRDRSDQWVRILVTRGDLIVFPKGIYHRFTLDSTNYCKLLRLYTDSPIYSAFYRPNATANGDQQQSPIEECTA